MFLSHLPNEVVILENTLSVILDTLRLEAETFPNSVYLTVQLLLSVLSDDGTIGGGIDLFFRGCKRFVGSNQEILFFLCLFKRGFKAGTILVVFARHSYLPEFYYSICLFS